MPPALNLPWVLKDEEYPHVTVHLVPLQDRWGETIWNGPQIRINLAVDLSELQRRCVLAHELMHVKAGAPCQSLCVDNEALVVEETAKLLLPDLIELGQQLSDHDLYTAAVNLLVTRKVLTDRLDYLTDQEMAELAASMRTPEPAELAAAHPTPHVSTNPNLRRFPPRPVTHKCSPIRGVRP